MAGKKAPVAVLMMATMLGGASGAEDQTPPASIPGDFSIAAVGDLLEVRPILPLEDPGFAKLRAILGKADMAFGNGEMPLLDIKPADVYPQAENGGANAYGDPSVAADQKAMGFSLISRSNNHVNDWGINGMRQTNAIYAKAGMTIAGSGESEAEARRAQFAETAKGRIALAATTTHFTHDEPAADPLGEVHPRPGASVLRTSTTILVDEATLADLKRRYPPAEPPKKEDEAEILGQKYRISAQAGLDAEADAYDLDQIGKAVQQGKRASDFLAFSYHSHQSKSGQGNDVPLSKAVEDLAHRAIDSGADAVFGHGPHQVGGIEIYRGKPIFYSLGNFIFQLDLLENLYPEGWRKAKMDPAKTIVADFWHDYLSHHFSKPIFWQSVVAISRYKSGALAEIDLYPIELGLDRPVNRRGIPQPASAAAATEILNRLQSLSAPYGTQITIRDGIGVIRIPPRN